MDEAREALKNYISFRTCEALEKLDLNPEYAAASAGQRDGWKRVDAIMQTLSREDRKLVFDYLDTEGVIETIRSEICYTEGFKDCIKFLFHIGGEGII